MTPTFTPTPTPTFTPTIQFISGCPVPPGWVTYTVKDGETLASIARAIGSTAELLQAANCLSGINMVPRGQIIAVPIAPGDLASFPVQFRPDGCTELGAYITSPLPGQTVTGIISLIGTASVENFSYYKLEIRPSSARTYTIYDRFTAPVVNASLGDIDTSIFRPGAYWIQLTVVQDQSHVLTPCAIPVIFQR
jgi:LysM repeat protein